MIENIEYWDKLVKLKCATKEKVTDPNLPNTLKDVDGVLYQYTLTVPEEELDRAILVEQAYTVRKIHRFFVGVLIASIIAAIIIKLLNIGVIVI